MEPVNISKYRKIQKRTGKLNSGRRKSDKRLSVMDYLSKEITFGSGQLNDQKKEHFFFELSTLLDSGIDLKNSLDLMTLENIKARHLVVYKEMKEKVIAGSSLAKAIKSTEKFSDYDFFSVEIGEETGNLAEVLKDLGVYYRRKVEQRRKIVAALTYPAIVLFTSSAAVFFMLKFVVPMFSDVFKRFGGKLPWMTEMVIKTSNLMGTLFLPGIATIGIFIYFIYVNRQKKKFRDFTSRLILKIPVLGELVTKIYLARFCNTMRLLISTKIPLLRAIAMSRQTIGFFPMEESLKTVEDQIMEGKSLHMSMQQFTIYPPKMIQLVKVGEEINKLDYFFENIADQYVKEVEHQTGTISKIIEPFIIIFLGMVVGFILVSMYLPMFEMSNSF